MPNKNDLSSIKLKNESMLQTNTNKKPGRKPKPYNEKCNAAVVLKFTNAEIRAIRKNAAMVPLATFLKSILRSEASAFNE